VTTEGQVILGLFSMIQIEAFLAMHFMFYMVYGSTKPRVSTRRCRNNDSRMFCSYRHIKLNHKKTFFSGKVCKIVLKVSEIVPKYI
jgi:hypothetical protein